VIKKKRTNVSFFFFSLPSSLPAKQRQARLNEGGAKHHPKMSNRAVIEENIHQFSSVQLTGRQAVERIRYQKNESLVNCKSGEDPERAV